MFKQFAQITNSRGEVEMSRLAGFAGSVAHRILASESCDGRAIPECQVFDDLAYMVREVLLSQDAANQPSSPANSL
jgi:hypothetical protein